MWLNEFKSRQMQGVIILGILTQNVDFVEVVEKKFCDVEYVWVWAWVCVCARTHIYMHCDKEEGTLEVLPQVVIADLKTDTDSHHFPCVLLDPPRDGFNYWVKVEFLLYAARCWRFGHAQDGLPLALSSAVVVEVRFAQDAHLHWGYLQYSEHWTFFLGFLILVTSWLEVRSSLPSSKLPSELGGWGKVLTSLTKAFIFHRLGKLSRHSSAEVEFRSQGKESSQLSPEKIWRLNTQ